MKNLVICSLVVILAIIGFRGYNDLSAWNAEIHERQSHIHSLLKANERMFDDLDGAPNWATTSSDYVRANQIAVSRRRQISKLEKEIIELYGQKPHGPLTGDEQKALDSAKRCAAMIEKTLTAAE